LLNRQKRYFLESALLIMIKWEKKDKIHTCLLCLSNRKKCYFIKKKRKAKMYFSII
jgi:hypothetical protein